MPHTFVISAGDLFGASAPESALLDDEPTVEAAEAMGVMISTRVTMNWTGASGGFSTSPVVGAMRSGAFNRGGFARSQTAGAG